MTGTAATQMFDLFAPGTMLGRNELLATIGEGGMARVILARQRGPMGFEKVVVVKVIHPDFAADRAAVGMLLDEARIAAQISHPNVVQTYELGEAGGTFYIVMEYLAGESLQRILKSVANGASFDPRMAARIIADVAEGLHAAHELTDLHGKNLGLIHRDVSLGNVVVLYNGNVKVVDFGIAKTRDRVSSTTQQGQLKGKYAYMSPEQIRNEPMDRRTDVFSLGVVLWECLALRRLFHADNIPAILMQILEGRRMAPSLHRPEVPRELDAIALRALEVDPAKRFQSTLEMKRALEDVIWKSRCDAGDVANYMTAVFGDRMRKRQALIASAAGADRQLEAKDATFDDTSGLRPTPQLPRRLSERPLPKKRGWIGGAVIAAGVMIGVGGGIRLIGGKLGRNESIAAPAPPVVVATAEPKPAEPDVQPIVRDENDSLPTLRSRLRPEHLEPVRVALPSDDKPADSPGPVTSPTDSPGPVTTPTARTVRTPAPAPAVTVTGPSLRDLYTRGSELFLQGSFKDAVTVYKQALAIDPAYAPGHRGLGLAYQRLGFDALAIASFKRYLALSPGAADATSIQKRIEHLGGQP